MSLQFINAEKRMHDAVIFPAFDLSLEGGKIVAVYSSVNVREQLINLLLGKTMLSQGEIRFEENTKQRIGYFFLHAGFYERLSIEEILKFKQRLYDSAMPVNDAMAAVQLDAKRSVKTKNLSFSEKKRLQLACLLIQDPTIYIFEEPDQNIDLESKRILLGILQQLKQQDRCIFMLTGNLESAITAADEVFRLDENGLHPIQTSSDAEAEASSESEETMNTAESVIPVRFEKIPTKVNDKIVLFDPPEIDYVESNEGQSFLHIQGESFPSTATLNDLEARLLPFGFFRCHRSYIVNLQKVREVITWTRNSYSLVLNNKDKSTIPLSKAKMVELKEMLGL